jgi:hypothetical protein
VLPKEEKEEEEEEEEEQQQQQQQCLLSRGKIFVVNFGMPAVNSWKENKT